MSLTNTEIKKSFSPVSDTTVFYWDISYFDETDVNVIYVSDENESTTLTLGTTTNGFSVVSINGDTQLGANITTTETYDSGTITIYRSVPLTQEADFKRGGDLPPTVLNSALDRNCAISQELSDGSSRSLICPVTDGVGVSYELPVLEDRKNKVVGFDDDGNATTIDLSSTEALGVDSTKGLSLTSGIISGKVDNETLVFDVNGNNSIKVGGVDSNQLATGSVETNKIDSNAVTFNKIEKLNPRTVLGNPSLANINPLEITFADDLTANSADILASQRAIKDYVDSNINHYKTHMNYAFWNYAQYFTSAKPIPADDTIPQSDEGSAVMELSFTPNYSNSLIKVEVVAYFSNSNGDHCSALFKDDGTDAVATSYVNTSSNYVYCHVITWMEEAGSTTERTYTVRVGGNGTTTTFNGDNNGNARYGETIQSTITITEIKV